MADDTTSTIYILTDDTWSNDAQLSLNPAVDVDFDWLMELARDDERFTGVPMDGNAPTYAERGEETLSQRDVAELLEQEYLAAWNAVSADDDETLQSIIDGYGNCGRHEAQIRNLAGTLLRRLTDATTQQEAVA